MPPAYSKSTQDLLQAMMGESKLTGHQQRALQAAMASGRALPATGPPPSLYRREKALPQKRDGGPWQDPYRGVAVNPSMTRGMGRKSQAHIVSDSRGYARDAFAGGGELVDREQQKEDFVNRIALGAHAPKRGAAPAPAVEAAAAASAPLRSEVELLHEKVSAEIEERHAFVREMRALGQTRHEAAVATEVAQRVQELRRLEQLMGQQRGGR